MITVKHAGSKWIRRVSARSAAVPLSPLEEAVFRCTCTWTLSSVRLAFVCASSFWTLFLGPSVQVVLVGKVRHDVSTIC